MERAQQQQQSFRQMTQEVVSTCSELFNIPISYAQEGLRSAQFPIEGYDELTVDKISGRIGNLSIEDLRVVRLRRRQQKPRDCPRAARSQDKVRLLKIARVYTGWGYVPTIPMPWEQRET